MLVCLLVLSAWPALVSERVFPEGGVARRAAGAVAVIETPDIDWFGLSPILTLLGASGARAHRLRARPARGAQGVRGDRRGRRLRGRDRPRLDRLRRQRRPRDDDRRRLRRRPLDVLRPGADLRGRPARGRARLGRALAVDRAHGRVLRAPGRDRGGHGLLRRRERPDDAVPRARVVLDRALRALRDRRRPRAVARGGPEVPRRRLLRLGRAAVRLGARLRRHGRAAVRGDRGCAGVRGRFVHARRPRDDARRPRPSRPPRRRSTCGRPTSTRARRPR